MSILKKSIVVDIPVTMHLSETGVEICHEGRCIMLLTGRVVDGTSALSITDYGYADDLHQLYNDYKGK